MGMTVSGTSVLGTDRLPHQHHDSLTNPLTNQYRTKDDQIIALAFLQSDRYWPEFCVLVDKLEWLADPRFTDATARAENAAACVQLLDELFAAKTLDEWRELLSQQDGQWDVVVPAGLLHEDPQVRANGYVQRIDHGGDGTINLVAAPAQFDGAIPTLGKAPALGADTDDVLRAQGFDDDVIADLRARGIVS
jgi:crotonobetainyl-CoA:carnitine CoA-transferase CaiB-like acyl-CoA transferase